jgi:hypothetical protein
VRGVAVAHAVAGARGVEVLAEHETAGLLEPQLLLELQGAHRGDRLEVVVEARYAHPELARDVLDAQRPVEIFAQPLQSSRDAVAVAAQGSDVMEPAALLSHKEPVYDLPRHQRREEARLGRGVQEPDETHHGVQQARVHRAHVDGLHGGMAPRREVTGLDHDRAHDGGVELEDEAQIWSLLRRLGDLGRDGQLGGGDEVMSGIVPVAGVAQPDLLAALGDHAKGGFGHAMLRLRGRG